MPGYLDGIQQDDCMGGACRTLVDLFAGCGGLALGFHQAGFKTLLANELHADPASTYKYNLLPDSAESMLIGPIQKVLKNRHLDDLGIEKGDVDCLAGGPPCQGFSMAGRGDPGDPRNVLYKEYLRVVRKIQPKSIVFENVPGFANRYGKNLRTHLVNSLEKIGYIVDDGILEAKKFGVPQLRKRYFCIGIHQDSHNGDHVTLPSATWSENEIAKLTAKHALDDLDVYIERGGYGTGKIDGPEKYLKPARTRFQREMRVISGSTKKGHTWNTKIPKHTEIVARRMAAIQNGATRESLMGTDLQSLKLSQRHIHANRFPNITVVSIPDDYIHYNTNLPRTLSVRECARLQTFPDHFRFLGSRTTGAERRRIDVPQYTQVGNAIPPRLANCLAEKIIHYLDE